MILLHPGTIFCLSRIRKTDLFPPFCITQSYKVTEGYHHLRSKNGNIMLQQQQQDGRFLRALKSTHGPLDNVAWPPKHHTCKCNDCNIVTEILLENCDAVIKTARSPTVTPLATYIFTLAILNLLLSFFDFTSLLGSSLNLLCFNIVFFHFIIIGHINVLSYK